jgi:hypothetical protein
VAAPNIEHKMHDNGKNEKSDVVQQPVKGLDGMHLNIRSAWYINPGGGAPRFVSAHPLPKL